MGSPIVPHEVFNMYNKQWQSKVREGRRREEIDKKGLSPRGVHVSPHTQRELATNLVVSCSVGVCVWSVWCLCVGCVWSVCGLCVVCVWSVCGLCVGCVWSVFCLCFACVLSLVCLLSSTL